MQKVTFKNGKGIEIDFTSGDFGIVDITGISEVPLNIQTQQVPFQDGSVFIDALLEDRTVAITLALNDDKDLEKRYRLKRQVIKTLNPKLGEGVLIYENDYIKKQIKAVPQLPTFPNKNSDEGGTLKASLTFDCPSPYWEDIEETTIEFVTGDRLDISNEGDVDTTFEIEIEADEGQTLQNPAICDENGDSIIEYNNSLSDKKLDIKTHLGEKTAILKNLKEWNRSQRTNYIINDICHGVRIWVAVGNGGKILSSADGVTWTERNVTATENINHVVFGNNVFVATCDDNYSYYSTDGISWVRGGESGHGKFGLIFKNRKFWCYSTDKITTSDNGQTWTEYQISLSNVSELTNKITYGEDNPVVVDDNFSFGEIKDGKSYTYSRMPLTDMAGIVYGKGKYIIARYDDPFIYVTEDLESYTAVKCSGMIEKSRFSTYSSYWKNIRDFLYFNGEMFFLVTPYQIDISEDGFVWETVYTATTTRNEIFTFAVNSKVACFNKEFDYTRGFYVSNDFRTWTFYDKGYDAIFLKTINDKIFYIRNQTPYRTIYSFSDFINGNFVDYSYMHTRFPDTANVSLTFKQSTNEYIASKNGHNVEVCVAGDSDFSDSYPQYYNNVCCDENGNVVANYRNTKDFYIATNDTLQNWELLFSLDSDVNIYDVNTAFYYNNIKLVNGLLITPTLHRTSGTERPINEFAIIDVNNRTYRLLFNAGKIINATPKNMIYFNGKFYVCCDNTNLYVFETDLKTFVTKQNVFETSPIALKVKDNKLYALCSNGKLYVSENGNTFSVIDTETAKDLISIEFHNGVCCIVVKDGSNGEIYINLAVDENVISDIVGNMGYKLKIGETSLEFKSESGTGKAKLKFKNKYLGV